MKTASQSGMKADEAWPRRWVSEKRKPSGVALVATLIMLSLVTFMTVAFLGVARRERRSMEAHLNQGDARNALDAGLQAAQAELVGRLLSIRPDDTNGLTPDPWGYTLFVSTNYMSRRVLTTGYMSDTNVNDVDGANATRNIAPGASELWLTHLRNLRVKPRAPVFGPLFTNGYTRVWPYWTNTAPEKTSMEEMLGRFYLDFNRNGHYEPTFTDVTGELQEGHSHWAGRVPHFEGHYVGDPHWIGLLENPNLPHGPSNRFIARYAFVVMPAGKSLDFNHIHNQNKELNVNRNSASTFDGFIRSQGAASWELNLAAFLTRLNGNVTSNATAAMPWYYANYTPFDPDASTGYGFQLPNTFQQAADFLRWRFDGEFVNLPSVQNYYRTPAIGFAARRLGGIGYDINGSYMWNQSSRILPYYSNDFSGAWIGSIGNSATNDRLLTILDLYNGESGYSRLHASLTNYSAATNRLTGLTSVSPSFSLQNEIDNRYSFYRMISQIGTTSDPRVDRPNLNWDNLWVYERTPPGSTNSVVERRYVSPDNSHLRTNASYLPGHPLYISEGPFAPWSPVRFFTNVAQALLTASVRTNVTINSSVLNPLASQGQWVYITNYSIGRPSVNTNRYTMIGGQTRTNVNGTWTYLARNFFYNQPDGTRIRRGVGDHTLYLTNITIWPFNQFTPEVRRIIQVAVNLHETAGNSREWVPDLGYPSGMLVRRFGIYYESTGAQPNDDPSDGGSWTLSNPGLPHVFRPIYAADTNLNRIFIQRWTNELGTNWLQYTTLDRSNTNDIQTLAVATANANNHLYLMKGFPVFFGAKGTTRNPNNNHVPYASGIPNFNEVSYRTLATVSRKVELVKTNVDQFLPQFTNLQFIVGLKAGMVAEAWLPYSNSYPRDLEMRATNYMTVQLTNRFGPVLTTNIISSQVYSIPAGTWPVMNWPNQPNIANFQTPLGGHMQVLSNSVYYPPEFSGLAGVGTNGGVRNVNSAYQPAAIFAGSNMYPNIELGLSFSNHLVYALIDTKYNSVVDYVNLDDLSGGMDLINMIQTRTNRQGDPNLYIGNFWTTNRLPRYTNNVYTGGTNIYDVPIGVYNQIQVALDPNRANQINWINYDPSIRDIASRIQGFQDFVSQRTGELRKQVPFTPTVVAKQDLVFEVNDPIVHYTKDDLVTDVSGGIPAYDPNKTYQLNDPVTLQDLFSGAVATYRANGFVLVGEQPGSPLNNKWRLINAWFGGNTYTNGSEVVHQSKLYEATAVVPANAEPGTVSGRMWRVFDTSTPNIVILSGAEMRELEDATQITRLIGLPGSGGKINSRFQPWGGSPAEQNTTIDKLRNYNLAIKDPGIYNPDSWDFPERKFASVGWMGRVHRGTPWQTLYMKSRPEPETNWVSWAGDRDTHPTNDWRFYDAVTSAVNERAAQGLLSVNQTNIAAWAAVLGGAKFHELAAQGTRFIHPVATNDWVDPTSANFQLIYNGIIRTRTNRVSFRSLGDVLSVPELSDGSPYLYRAIALYDAKLPYGQGSYVIHRGILYRSLFNGNNTQAPPTEPPHMLPRFDFGIGYGIGREVSHRGLTYRAVLASTNSEPFQSGAGANDPWRWTGWVESSQVVNPEKWSFTDGMVESIPQNTLGLMKLERHPKVVIYAFGQALAPAEQSVYLFPLNNGRYQGMVTNYRVIGEASARAVLRVENIPEPGLLPLTNAAAAAVFPRVVVENYQELGKL